MTLLEQQVDQNIIAQALMMVGYEENELQQLFQTPLFLIGLYMYLPKRKLMKNETTGKINHVGSISTNNLWVFRSLK